MSDAELDSLLSSYEAQISAQAIMCRETIRRGQERPELSGAPRRSARERLIWEGIAENRAAFYESELAWTRGLKKVLGALG